MIRLFSALFVLSAASLASAAPAPWDADETAVAAFTNAARADLAAMSGFLAQAAVRLAIDGERRAAPLEIGVIQAATPLLEVGVRVYLVAQLGPVFGPAAGAAADFLLSILSTDAVAHLRALEASAAPPAAAPTG